MQPAYRVQRPRPRPACLTCTRLEALFGPPATACAHRDGPAEFSAGLARVVSQLEAIACRSPASPARRRDRGGPAAA